MSWRSDKHRLRGLQLDPERPQRWASTPWISRATRERSSSAAARCASNWARRVSTSSALAGDRVVGPRLGLLGLGPVGAPVDPWRRMLAAAVARSPGGRVVWRRMAMAAATYRYLEAQ